MNLDAVTSASPLLSTRRLTLRLARTTNAAQIAAYRSLEETCRYVPFAPMDAAAVAERIDAHWNRHEPDGGNITFAVSLREQGTVIGDIVVFWTTMEHDAAEIGWVFSPKHAGRGLATEAVRAVIDFAFEPLQLRRIVAKVDSRNERSLALCRRLPMRQEGHFVESRLFKDDWIDEVHYAVLDREWNRLDREDDELAAESKEPE